MTYQHVDLTINEKGVATLTLNRPSSRNALNLQMCQEIMHALAQLDKNQAVRLVLVRGAGSAFCAGADLKERQGMSKAEMISRRVAAFDAYNALEQFSKPIVALVHGPCFGSGCEIVAACDFAWATEQASFRYPEVSWGTVGATQRIPRIAGLRVAKELLFSGRVFSAAEAKEYGLVTQVYDTAEFESKAAEMVASIAQARPLTMSLTKYSLNAGSSNTREGAMAIELLAIEKNLRGIDWQEAISLFGQAKGGK